MKYIKNSYRKYSKIYNLVFLIISISITLGLIISLCLEDILITNIYEYYYNHIINYNNNTLSNIFYPILIYLLIFILSLTVLGFFIPFLALFIENMSIGLIIGIAFKNIGLKGLLFSVIYFIITKLVYLTIFIYLIINIYKFIKQLILSLKNKNNNSIYNLYSRIILKLLFSIFTITIYNIIGIFFIPRLIKLFIFLL